MIFDILRDGILTNIGPLKQAPKSWQKRCCMLCHTQGHSKDTRYRFGIQFNVAASSILLNCFNCGFSSAYTEGKELSKTFKFFLKQINVDEEFIKQVDFEIFKKKNSIQSIREGVVEVDPEAKFKTLFTKWKTTSLPVDSLPITQWLEAGLTDNNFLGVVNYAISRQIYDLDEFYWCPSTSHNLNQRLIVPYYYKNKIVGFTSRLSYNTDGKEIPKYYQQSPTDFVYNLDRQQDYMRKYVVVNEGVLDAWTTDGVGILGETTQPKIDIINRLQKEVIVCPDRDKKGWDLVKAAIDNDWAVSFPKWEDGIKDAAQASAKYGRLLTTHSIIASAVHGREKIELNWKISYNERKRKRD